MKGSCLSESLNKTQVKYVTNIEGQTTEVLIPFELWQQLLVNLKGSDSGLAWIDEHEPVAQLLVALQSSLKQSAAGQTFPLQQLWEDFDD